MARELVTPNWGKIVYAHRITHIDNIPHILDVGFVHATSCNASKNYTEIGDSSIIKNRKEELHQGYDLSEYIPFYFGPRSPMLYEIQNGYSVTRCSPNDIVYCVIRIDIVIHNGFDCIFCDGHALSALTTFYQKEDLPLINDKIKYEDVYAKYWIDEHDLDLKRKKEAELLIKTEISPDIIAGFIVYDEEAKKKMINFGTNGKKIEVYPGYYF